jgi:hypothetical protein
MSRPTRCDAPVVAGKAWCREHAARFRLGQQLRGRSALHVGR